MGKELVLRIRIPSREEIDKIAEKLAKDMADTIAGRMEEVEKWVKGLPANIQGLPEGLVKVDIVESPPEQPTEKPEEKPAEEKPPETTST